MKVPAVAVAGLADAYAYAQKNEDRRRPAIPGDPGIWVLIFGDLILFGIFFVVYTVARSHSVAEFTASQFALNRTIGLANTVILLSSSCFVVNAVRQSTEPGRTSFAYLIWAIFGGLAFFLLKIFEYHAKVHAGIGLNYNSFFTFYYMYTGIHLLHVIIGTVVLCLMAKLSLRTVKTQREITFLESGAIFWHLVDLIWVMMFALLYLVR